MIRLRRSLTLAALLGLAPTFALAAGDWPAPRTDRVPEGLPGADLSGVQAAYAGARHGDPSVSVRGAVILPGTRTDQVWYRNAAAYCTAATFHPSNDVQIAWGA